MIHITESPRDGMQSFHKILKTEDKIKYINLLCEVGFDVIDVGSFVSERAVPQMADTGNVLDAIIPNTNTDLSVLVGNSRYAELAIRYQSVKYINYPFAISETFLKKNLKSDFENSYREIDKIQNLCAQNHKTLVVTLSMAFGNPYGEPFLPEDLMLHIENLRQRGMRYIPLADTTAEADSQKIREVLNIMIPAFSDISFGLHLHTKPQEISSKLTEAYNAGCRNFDTVFNGVGGCPMSGRELTANTDTMALVQWAQADNVTHKLNHEKLIEAQTFASQLFL